MHGIVPQPPEAADPGDAVDGGEGFDDTGRRGLEVGDRRGAELWRRLAGVELEFGNPRQDQPVAAHEGDRVAGRDDVLPELDEAAGGEGDHGDAADTTVVRRP